MKKTYLFLLLLGLFFLSPVVQAGSAPQAAINGIAIGAESFDQPSQKELRKEVRQFKKEQRKQKRFLADLDPELRSALLFMGLGIVLSIAFGVLAGALTIATGGIAGIWLWRLLYLVSSAVFLYGVYKLIIWLVDQA